uniref:FecR domain-containing protein n=1 Tax=Pedobacter schmidteae TaxID=2201271 RepID=UPI000EAF7C3E|nr:FecR domain-containing protein [Pedobacter schmidteae]
MEPLEELYDKYLDGTITDAEKRELFELIRRSDNQDLAALADKYLRTEPPKDLDYLQEHTDRILEQIKLRIDESERLPVRRLWPRIVAAAAILLVVGWGVMFYMNNQKPAINVEAAYANDVAPGKMGATLTLASGEKIKLSDAAEGEIAKQAGITVEKTADGQLVYHMGAGSGESGGTYNTLSTAKGETYILTLPDKSKVWLNAASSLTYSAGLNERGLRRVRLEGEAYFEVFKDKQRPFIVESRGQQVEVLGTHFNVSSYGDEAFVATTLIEGSVRVSLLRGTKQSNATPGNNDYVILKPGQQAINADHVRLVVKDVETDEAVAWKNGEFLFNKEPLESIMLKISRWYDVKIKYEDNQMKNRVFWASVTRSGKITDILKVLELTGDVHFEIEGRTIIVKP